VFTGAPDPVVVVVVAVVAVVVSWVAADPDVAAVAANTPAAATTASADHRHSGPKLLVIVECLLVSGSECPRPSPFRVRFIC
jgi:hypothetical protein